MAYLMALVVDLVNQSYHSMLATLKKVIGFWLTLSVIYATWFFMSYSENWLLNVFGIIIYLRLVFAPFFVYLYSYGANSAIVQSWRVTKTYFWELLIGVLLIFVAITIIEKLIQAALSVVLNLVGISGMTGMSVTMMIMTILDMGIFTFIIVIFSTIYALRVFHAAKDDAVKTAANTSSPA